MSQETGFKDRWQPSDLNLAQGHRRRRPRLTRVFLEHRKRFASFSIIGATIFILGLAIQAVLTGMYRMPAMVSYLVQAIVSIEASFLLNRYLTWRDRDAGFWGACARFNIQKTVASVLNFILYAWLLRLGVNYLAANIALTVVFTVVNYIGGDKFVFASAAGSTSGEPQQSAFLDEDLPPVSIIVPCKNNASTIRATVESLLGQDYPALEEVILIGSTGDTTWTALAGVKDSRLVILEQEPTPGLRDPAIKRDTGIRKACGDVIALADSDIVMHKDWLHWGVSRLMAQRGGVVAGGMRRIADTFWGRFVDCNRLGAKTPRIPHAYTVGARNYGRWNRKPPVTANAIFTRDVYLSEPIDVKWAYGYEDYEWFWRVAKAGHRIHVSPHLDGRHHHRTSFRALVTEYQRSASGCARFVHRHPDSPLARKRRRQAFLLPVAATAAVAVAGVALVGGYGLAVAAAAGTLMVYLASREFAQTQTAESLIYPLIAVALAGVFTFRLATTLLAVSFQGADAGVPDAPSWPGTPQASRRPGGRHRFTAVFAACLAAGGGLRFWQLARKPGWQYDEAVYSRIAENLLQHGSLSEHITVNTPWQPFLYQPPFYPGALGRWFALTGPSIYHARILGVLCALAMLTGLWLLLRRLHGDRCALFAIVPVIFDGWLLYVQRVSYIENSLLLLIVVALLVYERALAKRSLRWYAAAGVVAGFAAAYKQTGAYVLAAIVLCWLILRRDHRGHLLLLAVAAGVIAVYMGAMLAAFDPPGHDWFLYQTTVQIRRVLGVQHSGGTLTSPTKGLHLLFAQYRVFVPSLALAIAAVTIAARRGLQCVRSRSLQPAARNALLLSWLTAGIVVFGLSSLRFPQYFALILVPAYCFLWSEIWQWDRSEGVKYAAAGLAVAAGLMSFWLRVPTQSDNALADVQAYAATHISPHATVVTEEAIGDLIRQPYCRVEETWTCRFSATYAITWRTYLQSSFTLGKQPFAVMMRGARPIASFKGFSGTATVWRLK